MSQQVDVLLYGLGAIGSFYAFILSRCEDVRLTVVARSNFDAVKANGLKIISQNHGEHIVKPYKVVKVPADADSKFSFIVCAHKAIGQDAVPDQFKSVADENTTFVLIQNGVGNEDPFRKAFPKCSIISCVTWVGAIQNSPGIVNHTKSEATQIGLFPNPDIEAEVERQRFTRFTSFLEEGGTVYEAVENIQIQRWEKVVWNAAWNSITTLTMSDTQTWLESSDAAISLTRKLMAEVIEVARSCNVPLEDGLADRLIAKVLAMPVPGSSMQTDCKNGRPMEIDVILGTPVKRAKEHGINIPILETLHTLLLSIDARLRKARSLSS